MHADCTISSGKSQKVPTVRGGTTTSHTLPPSVASLPRSDGTSYKIQITSFKNN